MKSCWKRRAFITGCFTINSTMNLLKQFGHPEPSGGLFIA
jgi:hypothetical protein